MCVRLCGKESQLRRHEQSQAVPWTCAELEYAQWTRNLNSSTFILLDLVHTCWFDRKRGFRPQMPRMPPVRLWFSELFCFSRLLILQVCANADRKSRDRRLQHNHGRCALLARAHGASLRSVGIAIRVPRWDTRTSFFFFRCPWWDAPCVWRFWRTTVLELYAKLLSYI